MCKITVLMPVYNCEKYLRESVHRKYIKSNV